MQYAGGRVWRYSGSRCRADSSPVLPPPQQCRLLTSRRQRPRCPLLRAPALSAALLAWLEAQSFSATIEHHLGPDGRADLHVIVGSRRHTIEVQLSPIGLNEWRRRDDGYRRQVDHVTWLYGAAAETAAATEQANRGHALRTRAGSGSGGSLEIGVVTDLAESWSSLGECELRTEQFWTPHLDQALADLAAAQEEAAARAAREAAEQARREAAIQATAGRRAAEAKRELAAPSRPQRAAGVTDTKPSRGGTRATPDW